MKISAKSLLVAGVVCLGASSAFAATLKIGMQDDPDALDPATSGTYAGRIVFAAMCDKLVDIDADLKIVPQLATDWKWSDDHKQITFTLRKGVTFQDGTPFDAAAVKFNIERMKTMKDSKRKGELAPVAKVEVIDKEHVRFDLSAPFAPLLSVLSDRAGMMVSPKAASGGANFATDPVCSGPYKFKLRRERDVISLVKDKGYWNADKIGYDEVDYIYIPDSTVRLSRLQAGDIDIAERIAPTDLKKVKDDAKLKLVSSPGLAVSHLMINVGKDKKGDTPIGKSAVIRKALELSIDRNVINQVAFDGAFKADNQMIPPSSEFYDKDAPMPARNVDEAKKLLAKAGVSAPKLQITYENSPSDSRVAQIIQSMASEAGFQVDLLPLETASAIQRYLSGDFQAYIGNWSGRADPDPTLFSFFACKGSQNVNSYCNPAMDKLLDEARQTTDTAKRKSLYDQITKLYLTDLPTIPLYHPNWYFATRKTVDGLVIYPDGIPRLTGVKPAS
jgi:peptide/nickel transport system substrate-binding protein